VKAFSSKRHDPRGLAFVVMLLTSTVLPRAASAQAASDTTGGSNWVFWCVVTAIAVVANAIAIRSGRIPFDVLSPRHRVINRRGPTFLEWVFGCLLLFAMYLPALIVQIVAGKRRNDAIAEQSQSERDEHDAQELRRAGIKVPKD
jgi:hypothetical protein